MTTICLIIYVHIKQGYQFSSTNGKCFKIYLTTLRCHKYKFLKCNNKFFKATTISACSSTMQFIKQTPYISLQKQKKKINKKSKQYISSFQEFNYSLDMIIVILVINVQEHWLQLWDVVLVVNRIVSNSNELLQLNSAKRQSNDKIFSEKNPLSKITLLLSKRHLVDIIKVQHPGGFHKEKNHHFN